MEGTAEQRNRSHNTPQATLSGFLRRQNQSNVFRCNLQTKNSSERSNFCSRHQTYLWPSFLCGHVHDQNRTNLPNCPLVLFTQEDMPFADRMSRMRSLKRMFIPTCAKQIHQDNAWHQRAINREYILPHRFQQGTWACHSSWEPLQMESLEVELPVLGIGSHPSVSGAQQRVRDPVTSHTHPGFNITPHYWTPGKRETMGNESWVLLMHAWENTGCRV